LKIGGKPISAKWITVAAGILAGIILLGFYLYPSEPDVPPRDAVIKALRSTMQARSYEYTIKMSTVIDGREQVVSQVQGWKENQDRIHIKGQIFDSEIDFYQIDSTTYTKDQLTGEWVKITDNNLNQQEIFMGELNPLANFAFKELNDTEFSGSENIDGDRFLVYNSLPVIDNPYMEVLWKDFRYRFWVEPRPMRIHKAEAEAVSKNDPSDKLKLVVEFHNYNGDIEIQPPVKN
jgi:hypothetical protein